MATNKTNREVMIGLSVIVVLLAFVMAVALSDRKFARIDLTAEKKYSVSDAFLRITERLQEPVTVTYYISKDVPSWFQIPKRDIQDKLRDIEIASKGKIIYKPIDPTDDKELRAKLADVEVEVPDVGKDEQKFMRVITALELTYQAKPKTLIPQIGQPEQVEYVLASKILELTTEKRPVIAVHAPPAPPAPPMMGHMRQPQQGNGFEWLQYGQWGEEARKFEFKSVEISESSPVPPEAKLLILISPSSLNERQRFEVAKYLAGGGRVLLIAAPFKFSREFGWSVKKTPTGLEDYLREAGVSFGADFVADNNNLRLPVVGMSGEGMQVRLAKLPFFVRVLGENIDQESVVTRMMAGLVMPFAGEVKLDPDQARKTGLTPRVLARTSRESWTVPYADNFEPDKYTYDEQKQAYSGQKIVFAMLEGQFPFPWEGKPVPDWVTPDPAAPPPLSEKKGEPAKVDKKPGILLVCSAPDAFHTSYLSNQQVGQQMSNNVSMVINLIDTFSLGEELVRIRAKRYETRVIKSLMTDEPAKEGQTPFWTKDRKQWVVQFMLVGLMPLLLVIFAISYMILRKMKQTRYERTYANTIGPSSFTS